MPERDSFTLIKTPMAENERLKPWTGDELLINNNLDF
jgi:hypothetical protein